MVSALVTVFLAAFPPLTPCDVAGRFGSGRAGAEADRFLLMLDLLLLALLLVGLVVGAMVLYWQLDGHPKVGSNDVVHPSWWWFLEISVIRGKFLARAEKMNFVSRDITSSAVEVRVGSYMREPKITSSRRYLSRGASRILRRSLKKPRYSKIHFL